MLLIASTVFVPIDKSAQEQQKFWASKWKTEISHWNWKDLGVNKQDGSPYPANTIYQLEYSSTWRKVEGPSWEFTSQDYIPTQQVFDV